MSLNIIGLDNEKSLQLVEKLNGLLADYQIFYMNVRGLHWNIRGSRFFELHVKFEELYNDALLKVDEIAERILTLGSSPVHSFSDYLKTSSIREVKHISDPHQGVTEILDSLRTLLKKEREILELSAEANDDGTSAIISEYIKQQEKFIWMYSAFLNK